MRTISAHNPSTPRDPPKSVAVSCQLVYMCRASQLAIRQFVGIKTDYTMYRNWTATRSAFRQVLHACMHLKSSSLLGATLQTSASLSTTFPPCPPCLPGVTLPTFPTETYQPSGLLLGKDTLLDMQDHPKCASIDLRPQPRGVLHTCMSMKTRGWQHSTLNNVHYPVYASCTKGRNSTLLMRYPGAHPWRVQTTPVHHSPNRNWPCLRLPIKIGIVTTQTLPYHLKMPPCEHACMPFVPPIRYGTICVVMQCRQNAFHKHAWPN